MLINNIHCNYYNHNIHHHDNNAKHIDENINGYNEGYYWKRNITPRQESDWKIMF